MYRGALSGAQLEKMEASQFMASATTCLRALCVHCINKERSNSTKEEPMCCVGQVT